MSSWQYKQEIMRNKNKYKDTKMFIENDLTNEDQKIQKYMRKVDEERIKNKTVIIGYRKE